MKVTLNTQEPYHEIAKLLHVTKGTYKDCIVMAIEKEEGKYLCYVVLPSKGIEVLTKVTIPVKHCTKLLVPILFDPVEDKNTYPHIKKWHDDNCLVLSISPDTGLIINGDGSMNKVGRYSTNWVDNPEQFITVDFPVYVANKAKQHEE